MRISAFLFILSFCIFQLQAQTTFPVSGKLRLESTKEPLVGAAVFFIKPDSTLAAGGISDNLGKFSVNLPRGEYTLKINHLSAAPFEEAINIWKDEYMGTLDLKPNDKELKGVDIKQKSLQATVQEDTTSFNANAYKTNTNANAKDLLTKMPGVQEKNGEIIAQGEKVKQVLVDGKTFFGQDPATALNTLPAEVIAKIQIFDDQSEQSKASGVDDGTRVKSINIVTKVEMRNGKFGRVYAGAGTKNTYNGGGNINSFNKDRRISIVGHTNNINIQNFSTDDLLGAVGDRVGGGGKGGNKGPGRGGRPASMSGFAAGSSADDFMVNPSGGIAQTNALGINFQDNITSKTELSASYFFNQSRTNAYTSLLQTNFLPDGSNRFYTEIDTATTSNLNHRANAKVVHKFNEKISMFYIGSISTQFNKGDDKLLTTNAIGDTRLSDIAQTLNSDLAGLNANNQLMLRINGEKRGRSFFTQVNWKKNSQIGDRTLFAKPSDLSLPSISQLGDLWVNGNTYSAGVSYNEPLGKKGVNTFVSYDIDFVQNKDSNLTYNMNQMGDMLNPNLSNNFSNDWIVQKPAIGLRKFDKNGGMVVRLMFENSLMKNAQALPNVNTFSKKFNYLLPFAIYRRKLKNNATLFNMFRTYTILPQASQLSEWVNNTNPAQQSTGNKNLDAQYGTWIMSRYNAANTKRNTVFFASVSGGIASNYIGQSIFIAPSDTIINNAILSQGSQLIAPKNSGNQYSLNTIANYAFPLTVLKSNFNINASTVYNQIPTAINEIISNTQNQSYGIGAVLSSNISEKIDFLISSDLNLNITENTSNQLKTNFYTHNLKVKYDWVLPLSITFRTVLQLQKFYGLAANTDNTILLWNAAIGKQLFKNKQGEVQVSVFDILNQNNSITQQFEANYYQQASQNVLRRYAMLTFSYNIRHFKKAAEETPKE